MSTITRNTLRNVLVLVLLAALLVACGAPATAPAAPAATGGQEPTAASSGSGEQQPAAGASDAGPKEIVVGAALPLTGGQAREGGFFKKGYEMAIKEINDGGGIMVKEFGRKIPVRLIIYDDKSDNTTSVSMYEKLATEDKVDAFLGGYGTPLIQAHTVVPAKYQIPYVNAGGATAAIYERGNKWIFGMLSSIDKLANTLLDWMSAEQDAGKLPKPLTIAVVGENTSHGQEFRKGINDRAAKEPDRFKVVLDDAFELNAKDFAPLLQKVKSVGADAYLVDARLADYTLMQRQYTELGLNHKVLSYGPRGPEKAAREALGPASDYIVAATWWSSKLPYPQVKELSDKYTAEYNEPIEWFAALGHEAAMVLAAAIENAGTLDKTKVRDAVAATDKTGSIVSGERVYFEANGQTSNDYVVTQNMPDAATVIIWPKAIANGEPVVPMPAP